MHKIIKHRNWRGFTLLEILIVIAIIGLLANVIFGGIQSARIKADDLQRNNIAGRYTEALTLVYDKMGGQYPGNDTTIYCLGDHPPLGDYGSGSCQFGLITRFENVTVNTAVAEFLPSLPTLKIITFGSNSYKGPFYQCTSATGCSTAKIYWHLNQSNQKCINGSNRSDISPTGTLCTLNLN